MPILVLVTILVVLLAAVLAVCGEKETSAKLWLSARTPPRLPPKHPQPTTVADATQESSHAPGAPHLRGWDRRQPRLLGRYSSRAVYTVAKWRVQLSHRRGQVTSGCPWLSTAGKSVSVSLRSLVRQGEANRVPPPWHGVPDPDGHGNRAGYGQSAGPG